MAEPEGSTGKGKALVELDGGDPKKKTSAEQERSTSRGKALAVDPSRKTTGQVPAHRPGTTGLAPAVTASGVSQSGGSASAPPSAPGASGPRQQTAFQKSQLQSAFQNAGDAKTKAQLAYSLGNTRSPLYPDDDDDEPTAIGAQYDGVSPAKELTGRDLWKAVQAPIQSREGRRSAETYQMVINQFAVGHNPRYEPDAPDKPRGHIFVWDVSRAMNCEIPHFVGAKELSLGQTVDWLRHEGPMRGWTRAPLADAQGAALEGLLVVVLPKDVKIKQLAVMLPEEELTPDGKPFVAAAGKLRGNKLKLADALGVFAAECFVHP